MQTAVISYFAVVTSDSADRWFLTDGRRTVWFLKYLPVRVAYSIDHFEFSSDRSFPRDPKKPIFGSFSWHAHGNMSITFHSAGCIFVDYNNNVWIYAANKTLKQALRRRTSGLLNSSKKFSVSLLVSSHFGIVIRRNYPMITDKDWKLICTTCVMDWNPW